MPEKRTEPTSIDFLQTAVNIYNGYKISKDGLSREEDVRVMQGIEEEERSQNRGWRIWKKAFGRDKDDGVGEPEK